MKTQLIEVNEKLIPCVVKRGEYFYYWLYRHNVFVSFSLDEPEIVMTRAEALEGIRSGQIIVIREETPTQYVQRSQELLMNIFS